MGTQVRHSLSGMRLVYALASLVIAFSLLQGVSSRSFLLAAIFLVLATGLVFVRLEPSVRLVVGLAVVLVLGLGAGSLPLEALFPLAFSAIFLLTFVVPTWLSPIVLALLFIVMAWPMEPSLALRLGNTAGLGLEAIAFGVLAAQRKRMERERRSLYTTSGELTQSLAQVEYLAFHDSLTGLPNRRLLTDRLNASIAQARTEKRSMAVAFIDLDRFKAVNDARGHNFGDRLLKSVASSIARVLQAGEVLGRQGGDEFILLMPALHDATGALSRLEAIRERLADGFWLDDQKVYCTASFGVAFFPEDGATADDLLRHADLALYRAKEMGRNRVAVFSGAMEQEASAVYLLDSALHRALQETQFYLLYQPQVDILTGRLVGMEALLRWDSGEPGILMPDDFLPAAQSLGLMDAIDEWVLERALHEVSQLRWWRQYPVTLAINISATRLDDPSFVPRLLNLMAHHQVTPDRLEIEITESVMSRDPDTVVSRLTDLRRAGVGVAIDDFGVGYSSLNYLKNLPVSRIKIDRSFVADLEASDGIGRAIVAVAQSLHLGVVAEGVESRRQAEILLNIGCDVAQGFYYERPVPADQVQLKYFDGDTEEQRA